MTTHNRPYPYASDVLIEQISRVVPHNTPEWDACQDALVRVLWAERLAEAVDDIDRLWVEGGDLPAGTRITVAPDHPRAALWLDYERACRARDVALLAWRRRVPGSNVAASCNSAREAIEDAE